MGDYKHIERQIGEYIAAHYRSVVEVGVGRNFDAAWVISDAGVTILCTDMRPPPTDMVPPLIDLAKTVGCDLLVYHLGFETYGDGGETIDCGVILHRYVTAQKKSSVA